MAQPFVCLRTFPNDREAKIVVFECAVKDEVSSIVSALHALYLSSVRDRSEERGD